jgi:cupin fold WbuC family metalloprotein
MTDLSARLRQESPEVYYAPPGFLALGDAEIAWLIERAGELPRLRARICLHRDPQSPVHEMLIVHHRSCYVRPHRHFNREETLTTIQGAATTFTFGEDGAIDQRIPMGPANSGPVGSGRVSLYRMPRHLFHALIIESEWLVFLETTTGPFDPKGSEFAPWSPDGKDAAAANQFMERLRSQIPA